MMPGRAYLDHAASSPMEPEVAEIMAEAMGRAGNPSSLHSSGRQARRYLEEARESLADDLGARPDEVVFTSGGTEANNLAVLGAPVTRGACVAVSAIEHASVADIRMRRPDTVVLDVNPDGTVADPDLTGLDQRVGLVSVMWVNNETGVIQDIAAVADAARRRKVLIHSDAVQAFGHLDCRFRESGLDLMTVSAHKLGGPVGIGALVIRRGLRLAPVGFGGRQEAKLRSGTVPGAMAQAFAAASHIAQGRREIEMRRLEGLRTQLVAAAGALPAVVDNSAAQHSWAIVNFTFTQTRADDLLLLLDAAGIDASTGSACTAGLHQPSEVLRAMGRSLADAQASLRFSFGPSTTQADLDRLIGVLPDAVARARSAYRGQ